MNKLQLANAAAKKAAEPTIAELLLKSQETKSSSLDWLKYGAAPMISAAGLLANIWLTKESWKKQEAQSEEEWERKKAELEYRTTGNWPGTVTASTGGGGGEDEAASPTFVSLPNNPAGR